MPQDRAAVQAKTGRARLKVMARPLPLVSSATLSLAAHAILLVVVIVLASQPGSNSSTALPKPYTRLIYTATGPGGGGEEGGGNESAAPPRHVEVVGPELIAMPAASTPGQNQPEPPEASLRIAVPEPAVMAGLRDAIGAVTELRPLDLESRGPGSGLGVDGDKGRNLGNGDGGGTGDRIGPGFDGTDGVQPGNGVSWPRLVREVKPNYTVDAMRARVEGKVELEIVVLPDGTVGRVRLVRSLDGLFGLDQAAIDAVRRWRFEPGRQFGKAVPVRVGVELSFNLR